MAEQSDRNMDRYGGEATGGYLCFPGQICYVFGGQDEESTISRGGLKGRCSAD